jgi:hypothetical protein
MNTGVSSQEKFGVFISYSFEIESLARKIKDKLQVLDDDNKLDIFLASELGGKKYRGEIDRRLNADHILLLPYPHRSMKLDWVCFELGGFRRDGIPICIMNTNLDRPPEQLAEWNAFKADTGDLKRFFDMFFDQGKFTNGVKINPKINSDPDFRKRLKDAIAEIETEFAAFRLDEKFFTSRIEIASPATLSQTGARLPAKLNFGTAEVYGSDETLAIFGVQNGVLWSALKSVCDSHTNSVWLAQIEDVLRLTKDRLLAHTLAPFRTKQKRTFIPVISRIESIDGVPSKINAIFVELTEGTRIGPDVVGNYDAMPGNWKVLFMLLDIARRFRWEVIDPVKSNLRFRLADAPHDQWASEAKRVISCSREMQRELAGIGMTGEAQFFGAFEADIRASLIASMESYPAVAKTFEKAIEDDDRSQALEALSKIGFANKAFFEHTSRQIHKLVTELN